LICGLAVSCRLITDRGKESLAMALNLETADAATLHVLATLRDDTEEELLRERDVTLDPRSDRT